MNQILLFVPFTKQKEFKIGMNRAIIKKPKKQKRLNGLTLGLPF